MTDYNGAGLRRPDDGATVGSTGASLRQHANSIQTGLTNLGTPAVNAVVTQAVVFNPPFATVPKVIVGLGTGVSSTNTQMVWVTGVTVNGATIAGKSSVASALTAHWVAIGQGTEAGG